MCGITGFIDLKKQTTESVLIKMRDALVHRGPDAAGCSIFNKQDCAVGIAHRRLSIIDLSNAADQPYHYEGLSMVFNGEIYNFKELRKDLESLGHVFKTQSDTEVVLHAFAQWDFKAIDRFKGMFAMAILNHNSNDLYLIRDRFGVKPLYYYQKNDCFLFASELKAFHEHPCFQKELNPAVIWNYFQYGNIPSPDTIFKDTHKVPPGTILVVNQNTLEIKSILYWSPVNAFNLSTFSMPFEEAKIQVKELLALSIQSRMVSDVPVGLFLSGGYDSTTTAAFLTQKHPNLKTYTVSVPDAGLNEAPKAKKIAEFLGTSHHEIVCSAEEAASVVPLLPQLYDEPFADSSAIPTYLVSKFAVKDVKVALSADGGDELFAGYNRHLYFLKIQKGFKFLPSILGKSASVAMGYFPTKGLRAQRLQKIARLAGNFSAEAYHHAMTSAMQDQKLKSLMHINQPPQAIPFFQAGTEFNSLLLNDTINYLPNDILHKVDRASMAVSLEAREPFLDHTLFEFLARMPESYKSNGKDTKIMLKSIAHDFIPSSLLSGPKKGFAIPINHWLRSHLTTELLEYSDPEFIKNQQIFINEPLQFEITSFIKGSDDNALFIWYFFCFQAWYKHWML